MDIQVNIPISQRLVEERIERCVIKMTGSSHTMAERLCTTPRHYWVVFLLLYMLELLCRSNTTNKPMVQYSYRAHIAK